LRKPARRRPRPRGCTSGLPRRTHLPVAPTSVLEPAAAAGRPAFHLNLTEEAAMRDRTRHHTPLRFPRRRFMQLSLGAGGALALGACGGDGEPEGEAADVEFASEYDGPAVTLAFWNGFTGGDG